MSLESVLEANTKAMTDLTAAILGGKAPAGGGKAPVAEPEHDLAAVTEACVKIKNKLGADAAKALIKDVGKADALKSVKKENWDALYAAAEAKLAANADGDL